MRRLLFFIILIIGTQISNAQDFQILELESAVVDFLQTDSLHDVVIFRNTWVFNDSEFLTIDYLTNLRDELKPFLGDLGIEGSPDGLTFYMMSEAGERVLDIGIQRNRINRMEVKESQAAMIISNQNLEAVIDSLESDGFSGLLFAEKEGEVVINKPFGWANKELEIENTKHTIFGTGSRPIDYTVAAIMILDQQGKLDLNDAITEFFDNVPDDKQTITLRHLMNGESGLPDFFDVESDWDPDLAWINRGEAEQRLLSIPLLFEAGTSKKHSHAAFGLLAAVIERVSEMEYYEFLKVNFFDPAGMTRTGEYGTNMNYSFTDFAEGGGPEFVGNPNIPPNWGPTSWLIKGSGGMYSSLGDLQKFYKLMRSGEVLDDEHNKYFWGESVSLDGSMRGFELFSISSSKNQTSLYLFLNNIPDRVGVRQVFRALEKFTLK